MIFLQVKDQFRFFSLCLLHLLCIYIIVSDMVPIRYIHTMMYFVFIAYICVLCVKENELVFRQVYMQLWSTFV